LQASGSSRQFADDLESRTYSRARGGRFLVLPDAIVPFEQAFCRSTSSRPRLREVGQKYHSGVEPLHVVEFHPHSSPVSEHVDVPLAPDEGVQVALVLVDQAVFGEGVRELAASVHE